MTLTKEEVMLYSNSNKMMIRKEALKLMYDNYGEQLIVSIYYLLKKENNIVDTSICHLKLMRSYVLSLHDADLSDLPDCLEYNKTKDEDEDEDDEDIISFESYNIESAIEESNEEIEKLKELFANAGLTDEAFNSAIDNKFFSWMKNEYDGENSLLSIADYSPLNQVFYTELVNVIAPNSTNSTYFKLLKEILEISDYEGDTLFERIKGLNDLDSQIYSWEKNNFEEYLEDLNETINSLKEKE